MNRRYWVMGHGNNSNREDEVATGLSRQGRTLQQEILEETNGESPQKDVLVNQNVGGALGREFGDRNGVYACTPAETVGTTLLVFTREESVSRAQTLR